MVAICWCQCDPRLATYFIAVLSLMHFSVEVALLTTLDEKHRLVSEDDGIKFFTVYITHIYLVVAAVLLFFGAYWLWSLLCIPWLIGCTFNLLIYMALLLLISIRAITTWDLVEVEKGVFLIFTMAATVYSMWIVISFMWEVNAAGYMEIEDAESGRLIKEKKTKKSFLTMQDTESETDIVSSVKGSKMSHKSVK